MVRIDQQENWEQFISRKRTQRVDEAGRLWLQLQEAGLQEDSQAILDFVHFAANFDDVNALAHSLSEHYVTEVEADAENNVYYVKGSTRPKATVLNIDSHRKWVEYMADIGNKHGCVFSAWTVEVPELGRVFESAALSEHSEAGQ